MSTDATQPLSALGEDKNKFVHKAGPCFLYKGQRIDLRTITLASAENLANDPDCSFLAWKEESKRPPQQRGKFAVADKAAGSPASNEGGAAPAADVKAAAEAGGDAGEASAGSKRRGA